MDALQIANMQGTGRPIELRKVVIKLGSAVVMGEGSEPDLTALGSIADSVARLRARGVEVILVSSGAIGMARRQFPEFKSHTIPDRQALAAIGQVGLMHTWKKLMNERGFKVAQLLLTRDDMEDRRRYLNARHTLERLIDLGAIPVINENDTVTIDELKFGDNDQLSALVASKMDADLLIILSVVDGLHELSAAPAAEGKPAGKSAGRTKAPKLGPLVRVVHDVEAALRFANDERSSLGTGGMTGKLEAVRIAVRSGVHAVIACGKAPGIIKSIVSGQFDGTYFPPPPMRHMSGRERWLAFGRQSHGRRLTIDAGARQALLVGKKSLLAAGVVGVEGTFAKGDLVDVLGPDGQRVARGLVNYDSHDVERIKGCRTPKIREILGELEYEEVIHRDNLIVY